MAAGPSADHCAKWALWGRIRSVPLRRVTDRFRHNGQFFSLDASQVVGRLEHVADVAGKGPRLLCGARDVVERRGDARRSQLEQIVLEILKCERGAFELRDQRFATLEQVVQTIDPRGSIYQIPGPPRESGARLPDRSGPAC